MNDAAADGAAGAGVDGVIKASAHRLLQRWGAAGDAGPAAARRGHDGDAGFDANAWAELQQAGFALAMLDEEHGGVGVINAFVIARLAGQHAVSLPLAESMAANRLLSAAGIELPGGPVSLAQVPARLERVPGGWRLLGTAARVPWGRCSGLVLAATDGARRYLAHLPVGQLSFKHGTNLAGEPRDDALIDHAVGAAQVAPMPVGLGEDPVLAIGAALRTAQIAGAAQAALALTVGYARERKQFGRAIGSFQAVQQLLAVMATQAAAARVAADLAAHAAVDGLDACRIGIAKARASEAAGAIAATAHQVHGAIGFTRDYALHPLTHRLWSWRDEFGADAQWAVAIGRRLAGAGGERLWQELAAL